MAGYSCRNKGGRSFDQGEISYNIDYSANVGGMPKEFLPKNLIVSFKHNKILFEMISNFGNSGISNLNNPDKSIFDTYFSLFTIKYFYESSPGEVFPGFDSMVGLEINKTTKTSVILGYNCKNAQVIFPTNKNKVYEIWYTNEISIKNPNACTPYSPIDGVLMDFFFLMGPKELHFNVETVFRKQIPDEAFERRDNFKRVTREEIDKFINKMGKL